jgi:hypothetical protein
MASTGISNGLAPGRTAWAAYVEVPGQFHVPYITKVVLARCQGLGANGSPKLRDDQPIQWEDSVVGEE